MRLGFRNWFQISGNIYWNDSPNTIFRGHHCNIKLQTHLRRPGRIWILTFCISRRMVSYGRIKEGRIISELILAPFESSHHPGEKRTGRKNIPDHLFGESFTFWHASSAGINCRVHGKVFSGSFVIVLIIFTKYLQFKFICSTLQLGP